MGLTIHYSKGRAKSKEKIDECIEFLADAAHRLSCEYELVDTKLTGVLEDWNDPKNLQNGKKVSVRQKGVVLFLDEGSESLSFTFDYNTLEFCHYFVTPGDSCLVKSGFFCKTQFAENFLRTHHSVCKLLEYVKKNYVTGLRVSDDAKYYGKWDMQHLQKVYKEWSGLLSAFGKALDELELTPNSDIEQAITKAAEEVQKHEKLKKLLGEQES